MCNTQHPRLLLVLRSQTVHALWTLVTLCFGLVFTHHVRSVCTVLTVKSCQGTVQVKSDSSVASGASSSRRHLKLRVTSFKVRIAKRAAPAGRALTASRPALPAIAHRRSIIGQTVDRNIVCKDCCAPPIRSCGGVLRDRCELGTAALLPDVVSCHPDLYRADKPHGLHSKLHASG